MKIIQSTIRYYPARGGVEEYVRMLSEGLVSRGYEVSVVTSDLEQYDRQAYLENIETVSVINGVSVTRCHALRTRLKRYSLIPGLFFRLLTRKADLIHGHCFMYFSADAAAINSRLKKIPFVFNPYLSDIGPPSLYGRLYRKTLGKLAMMADVVVVISEFEKKLIEQWGFKPKKVECVSPGVNIEEFKPACEDIFMRYSIEDKNIILYVGRIDYNKGLDVLINALPLILKEIPETVLVIAGPDFGEKGYLYELAKSVGVERKIFFTGNLCRRDLISAYKNADVFVLPSRYEAFGIVLIEAMAAGIPVVATDYSAIPDIVRNEVTGLLFNKDDFSSLAKQVIRLLKNGNLREELIKKAYVEVAEKYNRDNSVNRLEGIYRSILRG